MIRRTAVPAVLFPLLAVLAAADAPGPAIAVSVRPKAAEANLGEPVVLAVDVENRGADARDVPRPALSTASVSLLVTFRGTTFTYARFVPDVANPAEPERASLPPGGKLSAEIPVSPIAAGEYKVRARYQAPSGAVESDEAAFAVKPLADGDGEKRREAREMEAVLETTHGTFRARLWPEKALGTCWNFADLAGRKFYDGTRIHRILDDFMFQGGDPEGTGRGGPGYTIPAEFSDAKHEPGVLSMARRGDSNDSAGCQFFVCLGTPDFLDGQYTAFGRVSDGMDKVAAIGKLPVRPGDEDRPSVPVADVRYRSIRLEPRWEAAPGK